MATDELALPAGPLAFHGYEVIGSAHNGTEYLIEALDLVARGAVKPMVYAFPKERISEAYEAASTGKGTLQGCRHLLARQPRTPRTPKMRGR